MKSPNLVKVEAKKNYLKLLLLKEKTERRRLSNRKFSCLAQDHIN